jgi:hypothetical protein
MPQVTVTAGSEVLALRLDDAMVRTIFTTMLAKAGVKLTGEAAHGGGAVRPGSATHAPPPPPPRNGRPDGGQRAAGCAGG